MNIGSKIAQCRKNMGLTQDALAQKLGVTNQAVSKWESEQSCPDILLLPQIADIFGLTLDELFGREKPQAKLAVEEETPARPELPWEDDGTLRVVLYVGHTLIGGGQHDNITFEYEGPALNVESAVCVTCGEVAGNVTCGGDVSCENVLGHVKAEGNVTCDDVAGNVSAGGSVTCDGIEGSVNAGGDVTCDEVNGNVYSGGDVTCDDIGGNATAGGDITCDGIGGSAMAGGEISSEGAEGFFRFSGKTAAGSKDNQKENCDTQSSEEDCIEFGKNSFSISFGGKDDKKKDGKKKGFTFRF